MKCKTIYLTLCLVFLLSSVVQARLCNIGAEFFYQNYRHMLPLDYYQYTTLVNYTSPSGNNIYSFDVRNRKTKKSTSTIYINIDSDGYINNISLKTNLANGDINDISIIRDCCLLSMGLSTSEVSWLKKHETSDYITRNLTVKYGKIYSSKNSMMIYVHEVPMEGGLIVIFIDKLNSDDFYNNYLKKYIT